MQRPQEFLCEGKGYRLTPLRGKPASYTPNSPCLSAKSRYL
jgi:hypothetical protein